jgi:hypothetical protein
MCPDRTVTYVPDCTTEAVGLGQEGGTREAQHNDPPLSIRGRRRSARHPPPGGARAPPTSPSRGEGENRDSDRER